MRVSINHLKEMKKKGQKIAVLTAYDYHTAQIVERAGVPVILIGDSLGNVIHGFETTIPVTMEMMLMHSKAVAKGTTESLLIADMPFMSYQISAEEALRNAARLMQEGHVQAVKLEGGVTIASTVSRLVESGIPVMGHIGLTPQSIYQLGGFKAQGKTFDAAKKVIRDAKALENAGAFALVLETIPSELSTYITKQLAIPTIGIGAGSGCDGQVQVITDILGIFSDFVPKHARQYTHLASLMQQAIASYYEDVKAGNFPDVNESISMEPAIMAQIEAATL